MDEINGRVGKVTVIDANTFSVDIDSTGFSAFTGDDTVARTAAPPAPPTPPTVPPPTTEPAPAPTVPPGGGGGGGGGFDDYFGPGKALY